MRGITECKWSAVNLIEQTVSHSLHWNNEESEKKIYSEMLLFVIRMSMQT